MALYTKWLELAQSPRTQQEQQQFWQGYFAAERLNYEKILDRINQPYQGTLAELAKEFNMSNEMFIGFMDGINSSLAAGEYEVEELEEDSDLSLKVDNELLYYNMLDAQADWLYGLPQWDAILSADDRDRISKQFRQDKVYVAKKTQGRNELCNCGSGKKYKNCCGKN